MGVKNGPKRSALKPFLGQQIELEGTIGVRGQYDEITLVGEQCYYKEISKVCMLDVRDTNGNLVTDHVWMTDTKPMKNKNLPRGARINFKARVYEYQHSDPGATPEYGLQRPGYIKVLSLPK
jgi:hypothetical protein